MMLLEDCGHVPHRERSEEIIRLATSFVQSKCSRSPV